jgi:hypothetical protein
LRAEDVLTWLQKAIEEHGAPEHLRSGYALPPSGTDKPNTLVQTKCPRTNTLPGSKTAVRPWVPVSDHTP